MAEKKSKKEEKRVKRILTTTLSCAVLFLILFVWLLTSSRRYNFVGVVFFPLWYVALGLGVIAAIIFVWVFLKKIPSKEKRGRKAVIGLSFAVVLIVFLFFGTIFAHLNHIFDQNESERYVVIIENQHYRHGTGRYRIGNWEFRVTIDGKTQEIDVPSLHAYQFQEGDLYVVEYHKGAFNEPYYIGVGAPTDND